MPALSELRVSRRALTSPLAGLIFRPSPNRFHEALHSPELATPIPMLGLIAAATEKPGQMRISLPFNQGEQNFQFGSSDVIDAVAISPDSRKVAVGTHDPRTRKQTISIMTLQKADSSRTVIMEQGYPTDFASSSLVWSPSGQYIGVTSYVASGGDTTVFDVFGNDNRIRNRNSQTIGFSPNERWFISKGDHNDGTLTINDLATERPIPFGLRVFDQPIWMPSSETFIITANKVISLYNPLSGERTPLTTGEKVYAVSPDGRYIIYAERRSPDVYMSLFDIHKKQKVALPQQPFPFAYWDALVRFKDPETAYIVGTNNQQMSILTYRVGVPRFTDFQKVPVPPPAGVYTSQTVNKIIAQPDNPEWFLVHKVEHTNGMTKISFFICSSGGQAFPISVINQKEAATSVVDTRVNVPNNGEIYQTDEKQYIVQDGKKFTTTPGETSEMMGAGQRKIHRTSEQAVSALPEGEQQFTFVEGDLITSDGKTWWYLANKARHEVNRELFKAKTRFNRAEHVIPQWMLDRISIGKDVWNGRPTFSDWDGTLKETQLDGGIMYMFISGYSSDTEGNAKAFEKLQAALIAAGCKRTQFLNMTYNTEVNPRTHEIEPHPYTSSDTKRSLIESIRHMENGFARYCQLLPRTIFIPIGHSLGGVMSFNLGTRNAGRTRAVVTLDSPLLGFDGVEATTTDNQILSYVGPDCSRDLARMAHDPEMKDIMAKLTKMMQKRGVGVITLENDDDWFVQGHVAVLPDANTQFNGKPVQLTWQLGHRPANWSLGEIVFGHGQIKEDDNVIKMLVSVLT